MGSQLRSISLDYLGGYDRFDNFSSQLLNQFNEASDQEDHEIPIRGRNKKQKWGPVVATRMITGINGDGRSTIQKAQNLKKAKNLETHKGKEENCGIHNSFAILDNIILIKKAGNAGVKLGDLHFEITQNVETIKNSELPETR